MEKQIELETPKPRYLFGDMWKEGEYHKATLLDVVTEKSKDGSKDLPYLHIKVLMEEAGTIPEFLLSKWRAKVNDRRFVLIIGKEYRLTKSGENFIFS